MARAAEEKKSLSTAELLCIGAAAMEMCDSGSQRQPWEALFDCTPKLDQLFSKPHKYQKKCRLTPDETIKLLKIMGFPKPRETRGRFKYSDLHRFMIFLMALAHYKSFEDLSDGKPRARTPLTRWIGTNPRVRRGGLVRRFTVDECRVVDEKDDRQDRSQSEYVAFPCSRFIATHSSLRVAVCSDIGINGWTEAEQKQWRENPGKAEFPECIGIVDGMYLQINRPQTQPQLYYSQYKKYHAVLFLVVCDRAGRIRHLTNAIKPGHTSETSSFSAHLPFQLLPPVRDSFECMGLSV